MSISPTSPITGLAQTGLTSPTYTVVSDVAPSTNAKQVAVTALGGTQTGVTISSVSSPFTLNFVRPQTLRGLPAPNPVTGVIANIPRNTYQLITRKGVTPAVNQGQIPMTIRTTVDVPAGADTYDAANVRAALSAHFGYLSQQSAGIGDTATSGVM
jgi:hypothetical protein